jgi:hypothetical protein
MARTTEADVKKIIDTELTIEEVTPFLETANVMITQNLSDEGYSDELMKQIETWLAAHFVAIRDPRVSREKFGDGDQTFHGKSGMGLAHTPYGQQVMMLDSHGILATVSNTKGPADMRTLP